MIAKPQAEELAEPSARNNELKHGEGGRIRRLMNQTELKHAGLVSHDGDGWGEMQMPFWSLDSFPPQKKSKDLVERLQGLDGRPPLQEHALDVNGYLLPALASFPGYVFLTVRLDLFIQG